MTQPHRILAPLALALLVGCDGSTPPHNDGDDALDVRDLNDASDGTTTDTASDSDHDSDSPDVIDTTPQRPDEAIAFQYDPLHGEVLTVIPDDAFLHPDEDLFIGHRIQMPDDAPWRAALDGLPATVVDALNGLDGWGINAAISIGFDGPLGEVPSGLPASVDQDELQLLRLEEDGAVRIPYEVSRTDDHGLLIDPLEPLAPNTRHVLVGSTALQNAEGGGVWPGEVMARLLNGETVEGLEGMETRVAEGAEAAGLTPEEVAFMVVFTTQQALESSLDVAAQINAMSYTWSDDVTCEIVTVGDVDMRQCERAFSAWSWRDENGDFGDGSPVREYVLPVSIWLPAETPPIRTAIFGHGLAHGREVGRNMAKICVPMGIAVVGIDAVIHGEHPDAPTEGGVDVLEFFALTSEPLDHNPRRLRDNFRQSTWDKLQLLELLMADPDADGDGTADLPLENMAYIGESFGGIMGMELLALTDVFDLAVLQLAGGDVTNIISHARRFQIVRLLVGSSASDAEVDRFFPLVQTVVDAGDASTWGRHVLRDRLTPGGETPPHMLLQLVIDDNTIPDPSSDPLVRALDVPLVPPVRYEVEGVAVTDTAPVSANANGRTAGFFQFHEIHRSVDGAPEVATHDYTPSSVEATHQVREFLQTWLDTGTPVIVDPYATLTFP